MYEIEMYEQFVGEENTRVRDGGRRRWRWSGDDDGEKKMGKNSGPGTF
jgi:hypothetical protein